jgi:hypothetical protein
MKVQIRNTTDDRLTIVLEPSGVEYLLAPGDYLVYEWSGDWEATLDHGSAELTIGASGVEDRIWNSQGKQMSVIGGLP